MGTKLYEVTVRYYIEALSEADAEMIADVAHLIHDNCRYGVDRVAWVCNEFRDSPPYNEGPETCGQIIERARNEDMRRDLIDSFGKDAG